MVIETFIKCRFYFGIDLFYVSECLASCVYVYHGGKEIVSDPVEQELQKVVNCHMGAGNTTLILCKSKCA